MTPTNDSIGRAFRELQGSLPSADFLSVAKVLNRARELDRQAPGEWVMVPRRPTEAMENAAAHWQRTEYDCDPLGDRGRFYRGIYRAMLAATSQPPAQEQGEILDTLADAPKWKAMPLYRRLSIHADSCALVCDESKDAVLSKHEIRAMHDDIREAITTLTRAAGAEDVDTESASFKEGMKLGRSESDFLCGMIENPQCQTCGARNAKEAESMCLPSGDGCPGTGWPLEKLWSLQAGAEDARDAGRLDWLMAKIGLDRDGVYLPCGNSPKGTTREAIDAAIASQAQEGEGNG